MRQDDRHAFDTALRPARVAAYPAGGFVGQESFMSADEILTLAHRSGIRFRTRVLDLCCGVGGPGRLLSAATGCDYLGVDVSPAAVDLARRRARGLPCRFLPLRVPPLPAGPFEVVLLLETLLAFRDKRRLVRAIADALSPGGRFACTVEAGAPLTEAERAAMPDADTVWPVPLDQLRRELRQVGLAVRWMEDHTDSHRQTAVRLTAAFRGDRDRIAAAVGERAVDDLIAAHDLWTDWLGSGRVRKVAVVAVVADRVGR